MAWFLVQGYPVPDSGNRPDNTLPVPPGPVDPGYSPPWATPRPPQPGWPTVPGWPGGSLPGGPGGFPRPDQGLPGPQPIPGWPAYPGGPGGGLPGNAPRPDNSLPGPQPIPGWPAYPGGPGGGLPGGSQPPLGIWGPTDPRPTPPIYIPIVIPPNPEHPNVPTHPIYVPIYPDNTLPDPGPGQPVIPPEKLEKLKQFVMFLFGNLPTDPDEKPTPV